MRTSQHGISLIEVLVTVFVMAIGLLGMASLQYVSLKNANSSQFRYQATLLAYDMAERLRTNSAVAEAGSYGGIDVQNNSSVCTACSSILARDTSDWSKQVSTLPGGRGRVTWASNRYTILVDWTEQQTGEGLGQSGSAAATKTFSMVYEP